VDGGHGGYGGAGGIGNRSGEWRRRGIRGRGLGLGLGLGFEEGGKEQERYDREEGDSTEAGGVHG
jgi:hypothetical protein